MSNVWKSIHSLIKTHPESHDPPFLMPSVPQPRAIFLCYKVQQMNREVFDTFTVRFTL